MPDFEVRRDDLRSTRVTEGEPRAAAVEDGHVQLHVERFGLSANNVTYGAFGDAMSYWEFFPAREEGWGRVPVWGFGDVVASAVEGIAVGDRFYGYFPMSTYLTVQAHARGPGFEAVDPHRAKLPAVYNRYLRTPPDAERQDETLLLRPLFATSFLIDDFLAREGAGEGEVALGSASSKTAYGLAFLLSRRDPAPRLTALTSARNQAFVQSLGVYDRVLTYDGADGIAEGDGPLTYVDMAGDASVREALHRAAGDRLQRSVLVGFSHWDKGGGSGGELPGPEPEFFFAPTHIERLTGEVGPGEFQRRLGEAWEAFATRLDGWLDVEHGEGVDAVERVWSAFVEGAVDPRRGHVLRLPEDRAHT